MPAQEARYSIPIPRDLDVVRERMRSGGFNSVSEYVRAAIRADLERAKQVSLEEKVMRAVERGKFAEAGADFWDGLKALAATGKKRKPG